MHLAFKRAPLPSLSVLAAGLPLLLLYAHPQSPRVHGVLMISLVALGTGALLVALAVDRPRPFGAWACVAGFFATVTAGFAVYYVPVVLGYGFFSPPTPADPI